MNIRINELIFTQHFENIGEWYFLIQSHNHKHCKTLFQFGSWRTLIYSLIPS
jgi:hypothetical protein